MKIYMHSSKKKIREELIVILTLKMIMNIKIKNFIYLNKKIHYFGVSIMFITKTLWRATILLLKKNLK